MCQVMWYLPHNPGKETRESETSDDAAARFQGISLSDKLLQGPSLTSELTVVLLRFHQDQVAF